MYTREDFAADVGRSFEFLESEYGIRRESSSSSGASFWVIYAGPAVKVVVELEAGGTCGVSVQNLKHVKRDPLERSEFDLEEIVAVHRGPRPPRRPDPRSMSEVIARAAETLKGTGGAVLKGDFEALHARQMKMAEALRRHNPLTDV